MPPQDPNQRPIQTQVRPLPKAPPEPLTGSPYDFIMNPGPTRQSAKAGFALKGGSKLPLIAGGGVLLVIVLFVILSLVSGGSSSPTFLKLVQQQAELGRVADTYYSELRDSSTKNFVINTQLTLTSDSSDLQTYLAANGIKFDPKEIALGQNSQTDASLEAAKTSGTLDSTMKSTFQDALAQYQQSIQTAMLH